MVRKESEASEGDFTLELENLALLKCLKHPNIVELLGSFTHGSKQNLIFPRASSGDLAQLFKQVRPPQFASNDSLLVALAELSFAVDAVHNFFASNIDEAKSGCHHDIKPKNILVDGTHFLLADFGLSKFKDPEQTSKTTFKIGEGYYMAPECQDVDGEFDLHSIRRSSDIWSFGCIIAELLTYMMKGPAGIVDFKDRRKFKTNIWTRYSFHEGTSANQGVTDWLSYLENEALKSNSITDPRTCGLLVQLVKKMLAMRAADRPSAQKVKTELTFIALEALALKVDKLYTRASTITHTQSIVAFIEAKRFESWLWVLGMIDREETRCLTRQQEAIIDVSAFQKLVQGLFDIQDALNELPSEAQAPRSSIFVSLRCLNQGLLNQLPQEIKESADKYLELQLMRPEDTAQLEGVCSTLQETSVDERLIMLANIRHMTVLTKDHPTSNQRQLDSIPSIDDIGEKVTGWTNQHGLGAQRVLVEWKHYGDHRNTTAEELLERTAGLAQLLGSIQQPEYLRILHCSGFYNAPDKLALGLVFNFPHDESDSQLITLRSIYDEDLKRRNARNEGSSKPLLGDRFRLAHALAASLLEFHKLGWLHKSISSYNIVFFKSSHSSQTDLWKSLERPYVVGFEHSRPNEEQAFTSRLLPAHLDYQHPKFLDGARFRPEFDFYSLGIVLLEIGLWNSIKEMTEGDGWKGISPDIFRKRLLKRRVPQLGQSMGARYREAVEECLQWNLSSDDVIEPTAVSVPASLKFQKLVVKQLGSCSA